MCYESNDQLACYCVYLLADMLILISTQFYGIPRKFSLVIYSSSIPLRITVVWEKFGVKKFSSNATYDEN